MRSAARRTGNLVAGFLALTVLLCAIPLPAQGDEGAAPAGSQKGTLRLIAKGLKHERGRVMIKLAANQAEYGDDTKVIRGGPATISGDRAEMTFADLPYGEYAAKVFHDENDNQKLDFGLMGPKEPYGFSNDARGTMGPPSFDSAKLVVREPSKTVEILVR